MNKIISIILSIFLFFNSSLFTILYSIKLYDIKFSSKIEIVQFDLYDNENIDAGKLHVLSIPLKKNAGCKIADMLWTEENEFILNGHYCDVVSKRIACDTLILIYIHDNAEDELNSVYTNFIQKQDDQNHPMKYFNVLFSFLTNVILQNIYKLNPPRVKYISYLFTNRSFLSINPEIPEPPPKYHT